MGGGTGCKSGRKLSDDVEPIHLFEWDISDDFHKSDQFCSVGEGVVPARADDQVRLISREVLGVDSVASGRVNTKKGGWGRGNCFGVLSVCILQDSPR